MDDLNLNPTPNFDPAPRPPLGRPTPAPPAAPAAEELSRLEQEIPKKNKFLESIKNVLVVLVLVAVIVGSFWISFQLGKRLLVPVKKLPQDKIEVAIPEAPSSIAHMQKLAKLAGASKEVKAVTRKTVARACPAPERKAAVRRKTVTAVTGSYYKLQAGLFVSKQNALNLAAKIRGAGTEAFARQVGKLWRVQAGAYRIKSDAQRAQRQLKSKGYDSVLIHE